MLKKTLPGWLCLLMLLVGSTRLIRAAGSPPPSAPPSSGREPMEISIVVRPDGTWEGEALVTCAPRSLASSDLEEALDAQVRRDAAAIWGGRGIRYTWQKARGEKPAIVYVFSLEGEDASEIADMALHAGDVVERLTGPVALEVRGAVRTGQRMAITLPGNPSTGYSWGVEMQDGDALTQVGGVETHQVSKGLGVPARQVIQLRAMETGQAGLRLAYRRAWQADPSPTVVISVQPDGLDLADVCAILSPPLPPPSPTPAFEHRNDRQWHGPTPRQVTFPSSLPGVPSAYNWCDTHRGCPPVRDQGRCGSCWAFATVGPLEAWIKYTEGAGTIDLAEQYLLSCNTHDWGCDGGWWAHDYHWNRRPPGESQAGAVLESAFRYQASEIPCSGPYPHPYKITSWDYVGDGDRVPSVDAIKQAIYTHGPVAAAVCMGDHFRDYTGGVFQTHETCNLVVNHAVVLVGWDDSEQAWILRNSWGPDWGESGYMRVRYGISNVGFAANYVVHSPTVTPDRVYLPVVARGSGAAHTLSNGDFEGGRDGSWSEYSSSGWPLIQSSSGLASSVFPHGGSWAAWLGWDDDETSILSQQITIPSDAITLNYWYWTISEDWCNYDYATIRFGPDVLKTYNLCEASNTGGWEYQQVDVTGWRGQTVELRFVVETDWLWGSSFFLDDVSISTTTTRKSHLTR